MNTKLLLPQMIFIVLLFFLLMNYASAVTISPGVFLNSTSSNSSITFSFQVEVANITITPTSIFLLDVTYTENNILKNCPSINHSTAKSNLDSSNFNCPESSSQPTSSGGSSHYYYEENKYSGDKIIDIDIKMGKNQEKRLNIQNSKGTAVKELTLYSKNDIKGGIKISSLDKVPSDCDIPKEDQSNEIYKIIQFNSTINAFDIKNVSLIIDIPILWIKNNGINSVYGIECHSDLEKIKTEYLNNDGISKAYSFTRKGFSTWIILGSKNIPVPTTISENNKIEENSITKKNQSLKNRGYIEKSYNKITCKGIFGTCWYWGLSAIILIIFSVSLIIYKIFQQKILKN